MISFHSPTLIFTVVGTFLITAVAVRVSRGVWPRILLVGLIGGLFVYNGIGAAYPEVPSYYLFYYFGFLLAFVFSFCSFNIMFGKVSQYFGRTLSQSLAKIDQKLGWNALIWFYLFLHIIPLLYPAFRIDRLISPPSADLTAVFSERFDGHKANTLLKLIDYIRMLLTPFIYIALYKFRHRIKYVVLILFTILYLKLADTGYLARSALGMVLLVIVIALWAYRPRYRKGLVVMGILFLPVILVSSYVYSIIRLGRTVDEINFGNSISSIIYQETNFPLSVGVPIIEGGKKIDYSSYLKWMLTIPIPKILTGEIEGARINYEISEVILHKVRGEPGYSIVLPGLVGESIYIYGRQLFWLHGISIGFLVAAIMGLIKRTPQFLFLQAYIVALFSYYLNRAGISSVLPEIINCFMLFYLYVLIIIFQFSQYRKENEKIPGSRRIILE